MSCPEFEALIDYADDRLPLDAKLAVENHLGRDCPDCAAILQWHAGVVEASAADRTVEPPAWVTRRAVGLMAEAKEAAASRGVRGLLARIRAALVFDSLASALGADTVPARSETTGSRQLLYSAAPYDIDLLIAGGEAGRLSVTGQVLATDAEGFEEVRGLTVELARDGSVALSTQTSEFGEFSLGGVAPGTYDVRLVGAGREIILADTPIVLH
jgi:hypothetical protein